MTAERFRPAPYRALPVYASDAFRVCYGANEGDGLGLAQDLALDDCYALAQTAHCQTLTLEQRARGYVIAPVSAVGPPGVALHLDCILTFMAEGATVTDVLVLVQRDAAGHKRADYLFPFAPLRKGVEYRLVGIEQQNTGQKLAQMASASFTRGTRITLGTGRQCFVEDLSSGDAVLTRDAGVQPIRWVGHMTQRAVGVFAPVRIKAGTCNNTDDILVSPDHRLCVYQHEDRLGAGRRELLVKARHLVNGSSVERQEGGFIDYVQLLFDDHQIVYANGIAAETMLLNDSTAALSTDARLSSVTATSPIHPQTDVRDVGPDLLARPDAIDILWHA